VAWASPALDVEAPIVEPQRLRGRTLRIEGVDILRSALLSPHTIGEPVDGERRFALLDDGIYCRRPRWRRWRSPRRDDRRAGRRPR